MIDGLDIHDSLRQELITGLHAPGSRLRPQDFSSRFQCSANTVREALLRLSAVGLVEMREQRGFRVPLVNIETQHDLTHLRIVLEVEGAVMSSRNGGIEWESRLTAAHHKLMHIERAVSSGRAEGAALEVWAAAELGFHQTLLEACGSATLLRTHQIIYDQFRQQLIQADKTFVHLPKNIEQHAEILDAALAHDETRIAETIHVHLGRHLMRPIPVPLVA